MNAAKRPSNPGAVMITARRPASVGRRRSAWPRSAIAVRGRRRAVDGESLRARTPGDLTPVIIDVTDPSSIEAAAQDVAAAVGSMVLPAW